MIDLREILVKLHLCLRLDHFLLVQRHLLLLVHILEDLLFTNLGTIVRLVVVLVSCGLI